MSAATYNSIAELLLYPTGEPARCDSPCEGGQPSSVAQELNSFAKLTRHMDLHERQELFIQTFDLNPICSLEMGWHLFGENYDRGLLLVKMRQLMRAHGLPETTELPDHLTHGIRLLTLMDRAEGAYFAEAIVLPAMEKMLDAIRGKQNPYEHVLEAVRLVIRKDFPDLPLRLAVPAGTPELRVLA